MTHCCLVRHGQTDWNLEGRYSGQSDVPLNQSGRGQAQNLAVQLQDVHFSAIYSSDLNRAKETAEIISATRQQPVILEPRFREINQGVWEGKHVDFIKAHFNDLWQKRKVDPADVRPPGGETINELAKRVFGAMDSIALLYSDDSVLIVSHGLTLAVIICKVRGIPIQQVYNMIPENTEPVWVNWL